MANADRLIEIFNEAKAWPVGAGRERFLAAACQDDSALKEQVLTLLDAHEAAGDFLKPTIFPPTALVTETSGDVIGRYKLREKLGEGGCGVVYVAEQEEPLRRRVALKVIKLGMDTTAVVARFEAERQALALMDHPHIAKVLEAGATESGRPFFVMELVRGLRITDYCDQNNLSTKERLALFIKVCHAIQHAHQKGIIHRDIKPSNILVTLHDGVPVPKVIDFGIAKATEGRLTDATVYTQLHQFIGTPAYMSPEQAEMSGLDIDTRSDIYSLGVLLYELLTGKAPFDGRDLLAAGLDEMRKTIREKEPLRPSTRLTRELAAPAVSPRKSTAGLPEATPKEVSGGSPECADRSACGHAQAELSADRRRRLCLKETIALLRGDLDWIVMKCLEKDRTRRYETANGLAADLKRHLNNEPVVARPPSTTYRVQKAFRRNKIAFTAATAVAASLVIGLLASLWQTREADLAKRATQRQLYIAKMNLARQAWDENNLARLRVLLEETATAPYRGFEWYHWQRQTHLELKTLRGHLGPVVDVSFSPAGEQVLTASYDRTARVWDANQGTELIKLTGHRRAVTSASWSPDGGRIVTASADHTAAIWDAATGSRMFRLKAHFGGLTSARFSPDGRQIVTGSFDGTARVWRADTGEEAFSMPHGDAVWSVVFSPDGRQIVTGGSDETAIVWDASTGVMLFSIKAPSAQIEAREGGSNLTFSAGFSPDGNSIVTASQNQIANLWDAATGAPLFQLAGKTHWLSPRQEHVPLFANFSRDGRLIMGGLDHTASVWRLADRTNLFTLKGHEAEVASAAFSADGRRIVTGSYDHTAKVWNGAGTTETLSLGLQNKIVPGAAFSPDGQRIVTVSWDGTAIVWQAATGAELLIMDHGTNWVWSVGFSPDGAQIVTGTQNGSFKVWDAFTGRPILTNSAAHGSELYTAVFSPDGKRILTAAGDTTAKTWDASTGQKLLELDHNQPFVKAAFSPDGRRIATVCDDNDRNTLEEATAAVWDAETGRKLLSLEGHRNGFSAVAYSPDGRYIVTGSIDWTATVWDAFSGKKLLPPLRGHHGQVISVAVSPDSRRIFTGGFDNTTRVWDAVNGEELLTLRGGLLLGPGISPDGRRFVAGPHPPVTVWEAASPEEVERWRTEERTAARRIEAERRARDAAEVRDHASGLKQWLVLDPVRFEGTDSVAALDQVLIPGEATLRPREGDRIQTGEDERVWAAVRQNHFVLDFQQLARQRNEDHEYRVAYAVCYLASETGQSGLTMLVGSDDHAKIYLNSQEIHRHVELRVWEPDQDEVTDLSLKSGVNVLVFKVVNDRGSWAGSVRFTDASGQPVKGIRVTLDPGAKEEP